MVALLGGTGADPVQRQALGHDLAHGQARAEAAERVLEDDLHLAAQRAQLAASDRPWTGGRRTAIGALAGDEAQQRQAERGLARAALADEAERLAGAQLERHAVDRLDVADGAAEQAALDRKLDLQVVGGHEHRCASDRRRRLRPSGSAASRWRV